jgi:site-specific DNA-methyltransferase (adenine-specific)
MVIPSRWMASGLGLTDFRKSMLNDRRIRSLVDYEVMSEVFPGVDFEGGACYFLWDSDYEGPTEYLNVRGSEVRGPDKRFLNEFDVLVRDQRSVDILRKVLGPSFEPITKILSVDKEFGWTSNFSDFGKTQNQGDVQLIYNHKGKRGIGYVSRAQISKSANLVDKWKVLVSAAFGERGAVPARVIGRPFIVSSPSVCTQTYLFFYLDSEAEAQNLKSYASTKFFRFLVSLRKITQHATRSTYSWVPALPLDQTWSDDELYVKFELTQDEIEFVESIIKPMDDASDTSN